MTKSDPYFGDRREIRYLETLTKEVPTITVVDKVTATHNSGSTVSTLTSNTTTLPVTGWLEPCDLPILTYNVPRSGTRLLDDGVVTVSSTVYSSGKVSFAGYTAAVTAVIVQKILTFSAGKFAGLKRLVVKPSKTHSIAVNLGFTDLAGVAHAVLVVLDPGDSPLVFDLRRYTINRAVALVITLTFANTAATDGTERNSYLAASVLYMHQIDPLEIFCDFYNSIDEDPITKPLPVTTAQIEAYKSYIEPFAPLLEVDAKVFNYPVQIWMTYLAKAMAYSVSKGWSDPSDWNDWINIRDSSKSFAGALTAILRGEFDNPLVPEHFADNLMAILQNNDNAKLLEEAALWAIVDDSYLEAA